MQLFTLSAPKYKDQPEGRPKSRFHTSGYSLFADPALLLEQGIGLD